MNKAYLPEPPNKQASVLVDAQTDIKTVIKNGVLSGASFSVIRLKIAETIDKALRKINSPTLRENAKKSLLRLSDEAYKTMRAVLPNPITALAAYTLIKAIDGMNKETFIPKTVAEKQAVKNLYGGFYNTAEKGLPLQEFQKTYVNRVSKALEEIAQKQAIDADDLTGRNSLRNFAEMQVRYERHLEDIQKLKYDGERLVVCSVHADCSDRCKQWQGRVYSLDGTYGTTEDGRKFVPLEVATDIYYTTKAGNTYKNGLLGFNCRHRLLPYRVGMVIPQVSEEERKREDAITKRQRELERSIIRWRENALMQKGVNTAAYKQARRNAVEAYERYKTYSKENGRAYYPDRVKIL